MKLGARIIKTGIAIVLALYLAQLLEFPTPVFAGIAAIFAIQPTIYRSYLSIMEQIQGNLVGAIIAVVFVLLFGNHIFIIGLAVVIVITINLKLKMEKSLILSIVTVIAIMESQQGDFLQFSMIRFSTILLGILSSFVVNLVFIPPKYETKLYNRINNVTEDIFKWIRISTRHASEHTLLKKDISQIKDTLLKLEQTYSLYKEERDYFKKETLSKSRKLVVYRQMITTTKKAYETLKRIHKFENEINMMPEDFQIQIQQQLDSLIHQHEQILLKYIGKIKIVSCIDEYNGHSLSRKDFLSFFFTQLKKMEHNAEEEEEKVPTRLLPLISAIIEYDEQLEHLEKLINSFQSFHKGENEVSVTNHNPDM